MVRRFALVSGLILLSALSFAPKASAQAVLDSTGTVPSSCVFGTPTTGTLTSGNDATGGYITNLANSSVKITCNGPMNLSISPYSVPIKPAAYTGTPSNCSVTVTPSGGAFGTTSYSNTSCTATSTTTGNFITAAAGTTGTLNVAGKVYLTAAGVLIPPGSYTLRTTLTAVP